MKKILCFLLLPLFLHATVLQENVDHDLQAFGIEKFTVETAHNDFLDVAIIGGGQAGLALCLGLQKEQVRNIAIFDKAPDGFTGPWRTIARMHYLQSKKDNLFGPALCIPHLTFRKWYEALYGDWSLIEKVTPVMWGRYLQWYGKVLRLPINHNWNLVSITPENDWFKLTFDNGKIKYARKVVLATGRDGLGGFQIPKFAQNLPKSCYFHSGEVIDPITFSGKRVVVVGHGASAFDAAATALESGATQVDMIMRKAEIPKADYLGYFGYWRAFYHLSDENKIDLFDHACETGSPPRHDALHRVEGWDNFHFHADTCIHQATCNQTISLTTSQGNFETDLLILATGYAVNALHVPELGAFSEHILNWGNLYQNLHHQLVHFPYLGERFEFKEKIPGTAPYLKNIHCFNFGAFLSHGLLSGDIEVLPVGVERLAHGIATDLTLSLSPKGYVLP